MGERGIDISEWQAGMDVERVVRENNISFVMVRTNYGSNHDDGWFHKHCDGAERGGAIVTPYVYPLATDTYGSVDDAVRIIGGRYDRLIVDWEIGSGGGDQLRAAHERTWEHGLKTPVTYDPAWYHQQVGSPNVDWMGQSGRIGGRWKSWYPDNVPGTFDEILKKLPASVWNDSRGGIATRIVQFTSSGRLSGWGGNLDLNYFPGSRDELTALLGGDDMSAGDAYSGVAQMLKDMGNGLAPDLVEALQKVFRSTVITVKADDGSEWEDQLGSVIGAIDRRLVRVEDKDGDVAQIDYAKLAAALGPQFADQVSTMTADKLAARLKD